ncbi:hypothetical protein BGX21_000594 [Mortierella sp. AD011]|nr:hypothetical protein BGX20_002181 [Mortierella sp. AD010]KAF9387393.1 hypothetical protein BGX21_000594 [Mortierella sp. AD011]
MTKLLILLAINAALQFTAQCAPVVGVCNSPQCVRSASQILNDMLPSADPCVDFSEFACGGFYEREKLREGEKNNGYIKFIEQQNNELIRSIVAANDTNGPGVSKDNLSSRRIFKKLQSYYGACMDKTHLQNLGRRPLQDEIQKMMEVYPGTDDEDAIDDRRKALSALFGYNMKNGFENPIVFDLWDDELNPGHKIMTAQHSGLGLVEESLYSNEKIVKAYEGVIAKMFYIILGDGDPSLNRTQAVPHVWTQTGKDVVAFEMVLAGIIKPANPDETDDKKVSLNSDSTNKEDPSETEPEEADTNEADPGDTDSDETDSDDAEYWDTIEDLNKMTPSLDWELIFKTAFPADVAIPTKLNMLWKFYLQRMETAIQQSGPKTIQNYFAWTMMRNLGKYLADPFQEPLKELQNFLPDGSAAAAFDRWKACVEMVNENLGDMAGHFFIKAVFPEASQAKVNEMIGSIRWSFEKSFWQYDWLDQRTRHNALQKLKTITQKIGYSADSPNVISSSSVEEYYRDLKINSTDHFGNQVRSSAWKSEKILRSVSQPVNRFRLTSIPQTVNAFYNPTMNGIEIPAGILQPPFFSFDDPEYLNFGGIGGVAAHELGHGFDNSGRRYDESGVLRDWWDESSVKVFDEKSQCFIEQYNEFTIQGSDGTNHYVNGWSTLGENIADNGGVKLAFEAWRQRYRSDPTSKKDLPGLESYTPEQLFFVQFARAFCGNMSPDEELRKLNDDNHSPRKWRINGVAQNSEHFAKAFKCKSGAPMNPAKKCILW